MSTHSRPWRLLVVSDLGIDREDVAWQHPVRVDAGARWPAGASARVTVPGAKAGSTVPLQVASLRDLSPASVRAALQAGAAGAEVSPGAVDAALHSAAFQRVEAGWRGLTALLPHAGEKVEVWVLASPRGEVVERLKKTVFEPSLREPEGTPFSLIALDFEYGPKGADLETVQQLASMGKVMQTPLVAGASPQFFDLRYFAHVAALPNALERFFAPALQPWRSFQATEEARWIALTLGRALLRPPYTAIAGSESADHAESVEEARPESFLWGNGSWLVATAVARSVNAHGHALDLAGNTGGGFADRPTRAYPHSTNESVSLSTEAPLDDMKALEFVRAGFSPLVGRLRGDALVFPMVVTAFRLQPGKLTLEATLAYQITAGRLARFCGSLLDALPAGDPASRAEFVRLALREHLGSLAGGDPEAVRVTVVDGPAAEVAIRCAVPLEGKPLEFGFLLPI